MKDSLEPFNVMRYKRWEIAPRVPQIAAFLFPGAIAQGGFLAFAALGVTYIGVHMVASWAINALMPKPSFGNTEGSSQGLLVNQRDATGVQDVVYGEVRKGGTITYMEATGDNNEYLHMIVSVAGHEINSFEQFYINDDAVNLDGNDFVEGSAYADGDGDKKILIKTFTGAANQNVYTTLSGVTDGPNWAGKEQNDDTNFRGQGIACFYVRMKFDQTVFAQGVPLFTVRIKGKKVGDPRDTSTYSNPVYSANAALCVRDYLVSNYGLDSFSDINSTAFSTAANVCDEDVTLAAGGTEKRYEINGVIRLDRSPGDILADMMTACQGSLFWGQGEWTLKVGDYNASVETFTMDDLRGPITLDTKNSRRNNFNIVRGTFNNAESNYLVADYPEQRSSTFISDDNNIESAIDLPLPFTTSKSMAQRLAKLTLYRSREQLTLTADFSLRAFDVEVGDVIALTNSRYGFTAKEFEVIGWKFFNDGDAGDQKVNLTLRETSSNAYDWNADETAFTTNNSTLPNPGANLSVTNLAATDSGNTQGDGTFINSVVLSWTAPSNAFVTHYDVEYKPVADSNYKTTTTTQSSIELSPVIDAVQYSFRVRAVTSDGRRGAYASITHTVGGDTTAPSPATGLSATGGIQNVTLDWTAPTTQVGGGTLFDLKGYYIYRSTSNSQPASNIAFVSADKYIDGALSGSTTYYYWVEAVDFTGNTSTAVASGAVTTLDPPSDGADGAPGQNGTNGTNGSDGADGDTVVTGKVFYFNLQSSNPGTPSASSYNVSTASFTGLTSGWSLTQPSVEITDTSVREWSSNFTVTIDGSTNAQTISFTSASGAIQVTSDLESDNYVQGSSGWRIRRSNGDAEFGSAVIRGTLSVGQLPGITKVDTVQLDYPFNQTSTVNNSNRLKELSQSESFPSGITTPGSANTLQRRVTSRPSLSNLTSGSKLMALCTLVWSTPSDSSTLQTPTFTIETNTGQVRYIRFAPSRSGNVWSISSQQGQMINFTTAVVLENNTGSSATANFRFNLGSSSSERWRVFHYDFSLFELAK